jgi:hypothetical protein
MYNMLANDLADSLQGVVWVLGVGLGSLHSKSSRTKILLQIALSNIVTK